MSMIATIVSCGACGNKSTINLIEKGIIPADHAKLLNTTTMDIPDKYKTDTNVFKLFGKSISGCGKESSRGRSYMIKAIEEGQIIPEDLINEDSKEIIIVSSSEGGSAGGARVLAKYYDSMNIPIHVFIFIGFGDDARGLSNTLSSFKELPDNVILHTICNSHFLDYTNNHLKAEQAANDEFAREVEILLGHKLIPSKQNIDQMDLYKINTQPGYCIINHVPLNGIKNVEGFNAAVAKVFEDPCYLDNDLSAKRIAVMINAGRKVQECIDNSYEVIKRYVGTPIEIFQHIQPDDESDLIGDEYIDIIATGMNYPEKPIKDISIKYNKLKENLNTTRKSFSDIYDDIDLGEDEVDEFNMNIKRKGKAASIEDLFGNENRIDVAVDIVEETNPKVNTKKKNDDKEVAVENTKDLQKYKFVNTTVNQSIYAPEYDSIDVEDIENPMGI